MSKETELLISKLDGMIQGAIQTALAELSGETLIEIAKAPTPVAYYAVNELGKRKPNLFKLYDELIIPRDSFIELYKKAKDDIVFGQEEIYNKELPLKEALELSDKSKEERILTGQLYEWEKEMIKSIPAIMSALQSMGLLENKTT